ncbi:glycosyltransferase family 4 protein [Paraburkholderia panacisoli]|uniref:Glycosyltransferase family 4 protein n=1 Tax=Paraburkholderia panacisoli TaxID=2603818 RepID=A0A5B0GID7_9BURK|nr:glycosyltransferase family 4 protein [Paraburkholderia panacisoli]KAA1002565.1 glycosyltransferase family 4 protein [Paraburkholderia panacisoli]
MTVLNLVKRLFAPKTKPVTFERPDIDPNKLRLLIELASFDKGGLEKVVLDSAIAFNRNRFDVTIVTAGKVGHLGAVAREAGLRVIGLPEHDTLAAYGQLLSKLEPHLAMSHFSYVGYPLFAEFGIRNITFIHNVYAFFSAEQARAFADNDRYVDRYISVSKNATRYAAARLGVEAEKVITVPNGLIISEHEAREKKPGTLRRSDLGIAETDYVFANVASYNLHKGHYVMVDAMKRILAKRSDIKILCVGNPVFAPHVEALKQQIKRDGLERHILMPGYVADVAEVHRIADAFLLPSFIEGWSIAMNEAMFYGKPMVLTDTGASAEVIENDDIGILIPNEYGDTTELDSVTLDQLAYAPRAYTITSRLVEAMETLADHREEWAARGERGRAKIYSSYDFNDIVRRYEEVIEEVVREQRR